MGLRIIYGRSGSGKSKYIFSEIAKLVKTEKKIYVITPEQFSFTAEKKLMDELKENAVINAEVVTLSRMAHRVLQEIGGNTNTMLTKSGKAMMVYFALNEQKNKLKFLSKSDENISLSMNAITEFKKHGVTPEILQNEIKKIDDEYLKIKLNDMYLIYENYEKKLQGDYIEDTDLLTFLAEHIEETDIIKNSLIYIDEFSGFTYQEYNVIKKFIELAKQVTITVCTDDLEQSNNPDTDVFYSNKKTVSKLLNIVKEHSLKLEKPIFLDDCPRFKTQELKHLEQNMFSTHINIYNKKSTNNNTSKYDNEKINKNINIFLAKNQYSEIENVAKQIVKLVRDKHLRYREISVVTKEINEYSSLVRSIFAEYKIPVFIDEKRDLNQNIIVQYLLSIFEIFTQNFSRESVFNYLKIGFADIENDDIFKLENYCIKWGIKHNKWKNNFIYGIDEKNKEDIEYLNKLRKQIITPLVNLKENFGTVEETTKAIYEFLQVQNIEDKINKKVLELQEIGEIDLANEYISSYKIILNIFDEMVLVFGNEKFSIDKYFQILKIGLKNSELGKIPGTQDQVIFGDVDRSRSHKVDVVFIIGLNDGKFPSINRQEGFLGDNDREKLKNDGIELANGTIENLYEENFNIYKAFTTAEKSLYLSYSSSDGEGKSLRPSMIINKIKKIFPEIVESSDVINKNYEITNEVMTYQELLENISNLKNHKKIDDIWYAVYKFYKNQNDWNARLQRDLNGINYSNLPKNLNKNIVNKLYGNTLNTSVSRLEQFAKCPFSYYLQYGLKLKEKEGLKVQSFDTGSFMHEVIDEFFKKIKEENIELKELVKNEKENNELSNSMSNEKENNLPDFENEIESNQTNNVNGVNDVKKNEDKIQDLVKEIIENKLEMGKKYSFVATPKYKVLVKRLERIVSKALQYIIEGLVNSEFNIEGTEVEFSEKGKYKPIILELNDGKKVEITGKIDRIDTANSDDGRYLRIIDYKSSAKNIDLNEVYAGIQLQLLTYLDAVCRVEDVMPAGVLYFSLLEQMVKSDKKISEEEIEEEIRKNFKMKGLILADVKVIKLHDKNLTQGTSKLIPATLTKNGEISESKTSGVNKEEFKILQDYIYKTIKEISKEILKGNIDLKPYNKKGNTPCDYCKYKTICGFTPGFCKNTYNFIPNKSKDDVIRKMKLV